jgi:hypothetical protein
MRLARHPQQAAAKGAGEREGPRADGEGWRATEGEEQPMSNESEFDTDIRVGDLVELVAVDQRADEEHRTGVLGARGIVRWFGSYLTPPPHEVFYTVLLGDGSGYLYGRFRIIERDGKPCVRETVGSIRCGDTALAVTNIVHHGPRHGKAGMSAALVSQAREAGRDVAVLKRQETVEFDADIRVGDVVEVVSLDEAGMRVRGLALPASLGAGLRGAVRSVGRRCVLIETVHGLYAVHGHFRILERDGKPHVRTERLANLPQLPVFRLESETGEALGVGHQLTGGAKKRETVPAAAPEPEHCAWCRKDLTGAKRGATVSIEKTGERTCFDCMPYYAALLMRTEAGAYDTPDERESVRRFVDGKSAPSPCRHCGKPNAFTVYGGGLKVKDITCRACAMSRERDKRGERPGAEIDPTSEWSAGSNPNGAEWP